MIGRNTEHDGFHTLVQEINEKLGPSSGIDSADVDAKELQHLMEAYVSDESEWSKYVFCSEHMPYTRNLVDKGNGKSNLLILVWGPGKKSPIHDEYLADLLIDALPQETCRHAKAHCIMKVLKGSLIETRFAAPTAVQINANEDRPMVKTRETTYSENGVTYMADTLGVHRISNPHPTEYAVSLHLYTPPNAAAYGCNTFDEATSHVNHASQCHFYSEYGVKVNKLQS
ncbi:cysteine dioxygenase type I [Decorospora gaudefroyi]|uniref:Cysteine dioxygenase n=1 Tax=Decorospora gaudefroyi TaxID=184978 RepID=A0A6A5K5X8_9PLEO|nr:cysteine dioxygenase type I [Decorospora gaudefroyi]